MISMNVDYTVAMNPLLTLMLSCRGTKKSAGALIAKKFAYFVAIFHHLYQIVIAVFLTKANKLPLKRN